MTSLKAFKDIQKKLAQYDEKRELLIKKSRDVLKLSKLLIYSVHRNDMKEAAKIAVDAQKAKKELSKLAEFDHKLVFEGSYSEACQEFIEAFCYYQFVKDKTIPGPEDLEVSSEDYIMGIADLTGELTRRAVAVTTKKAYKEAEDIQKVVEDIYGEFLKFNLHNGLIRKKFDAMKWHIKKLEEILYDIASRK